MNRLNLRNNRLKSKTTRKIPIISEFTDLQNIPQFKKRKPESVNMPPLILANTKISAGYAQKSPRSLVLYTIGQQAGQVFGHPKKWKCSLNPTRRERTTRIRLPSIPSQLYASTKDLGGLLCHFGVEPPLNHLEIVKYEYSSYVESVLHFHHFNKRVHVGTTNPSPNIFYQIQYHHIAGLNHLCAISIGTFFWDNERF